MNTTARQLSMLFEAKIASVENKDKRKFKHNGNHFDYKFSDVVDGIFSIQLFDGKATVEGPYGIETFTGDKIVSDILEYLGDFDIPSYDFPFNELV